MHLFKFIALPGVLLLLGACIDSSVPFEPELLPSPAGGPATGPRLSGGDGAPLILSWMEENDDGASLHYSRLGRDGWSPGSAVVEGVEMFVNWADMPSVQPMGDRHLAAHWLEKSADLTYAYDVVFTQSADDGDTWSAPIRPHSDGTPTEHGFVSMFNANSGTGLIWLDGRKMVNEATDDKTATGMTLRTAVIDENSNIHEEQLVDELICDCCQTGIALASSGPVAVYRDRSTAEIRDISVTRLVDGKWQAGVTLGPDNWEIPGCPVNGPSISAHGDIVAVARFTAAGGQPKVKLALSSDSGRTFGDDIEVASGKVLGRVGVVHLQDGDVAVSWLQTSAEGSNEVVVRKFRDNGQASAVHTVAKEVGSFSVPQMAVIGDDLIFVWTETEEFVNTLHSARVAVESL
jgi:hypothetical protein